MTATTQLHEATEKPESWDIAHHSVILTAAVPVGSLDEVIQSLRGGAGEVLGVDANL